MQKRIIKIISSILLFFSTVSFAASNVLKSEKQKVATEEISSVVIIGGGIGALTSGIYLARAGYNPIIIEGSLPGGLITQSHLVENWPSHFQISGADLAEKLRSQAINNGCSILSKEVVDVDFSKKPYLIAVKDLFKKDQIEKIFANSCIIAMGSSSNYLNVEGEKKYWGKGVTNCAVCDGALYKNKNVAIVGGGDAAVTEGLYLSNLADKVTVLVRKDALKASDKPKIDSLNQKKNVEIIYNTNVVSINGDDETLKSVTVFDNSKKTKYDISIAGLFLAIGSKPNTKIFENKLELDKMGYIKINNNFQTSISDVYAVGDIVDPVFKQAITAAGDGAKAAILLQKSLDEQKPSKENTKKDLVKKSSDQTFSVIDIKDINEFEKEMSSNNTPIIIDFYATWCGPCKRLSPILEDHAKTLKGKVRILKINVEKLHNISSKYEVRAMPTVVVLDKHKNMLFKKTGSDDIFSLLFSLDKIKEKSVNDIENFLIKMK
jgi:thioredoxin reductase (NADPH)